MPKELHEELGRTRAMVAGLEKVTGKLACTALKSWESGHD